MIIIIWCQVYDEGFRKESLTLMIIPSKIMVIVSSFDKVSVHHSGEKPSSSGWSKVGYNTVK